MLEENNIFYSPLCFQSEVSIIKVYESNYSSMVTYFVSFSHFSFYVNVFYFAEKSVFKDTMKLSGKGAYGSVYLINLYGEDIAIKSINLNSNSENNVK